MPKSKDGPRGSGSDEEEKNKKTPSKKEEKTDKKKTPPKPGILQLFFGGKYKTLKESHSEEVEDELAEKEKMKQIEMSSKKGKSKESVSKHQETESQPGTSMQHSQSDSLISPLRARMNIQSPLHPETHQRTVSRVDSGEQAISNPELEAASSPSSYKKAMEIDYVKDDAEMKSQFDSEKRESSRSKPKIGGPLSQSSYEKAMERGYVIDVAIKKSQSDSKERETSRSILKSPRRSSSSAMISQPGYSGSSGSSRPSLTRQDAVEESNPVNPTGTMEIKKGKICVSKKEREDKKDKHVIHESRSDIIDIGTGFKRPLKHLKSASSSSVSTSTDSTDIPESTDIDSSMDVSDSPSDSPKTDKRKPTDKYTSEQSEEKKRKKER